MRFPKSHRLRSKSDFASIRKGKRIRAGNLRVTYRLNSLAHARLGFAVSRKYGNAVERNRLKRQLRETFRKSLITRSMGVDVFIVPATGANQMHAAADDLLQALNTIRGKPEVTHGV